MAEWHRVAAVSEVLRAPRELTAGGRVIALFNVEGTLYALDGICPHAGGPLGEGALRVRRHVSVARLAIRRDDRSALPQSADRAHDDFR